MIDLWHLTNIDWMSHLQGELAEQLRQAADISTFQRGDLVFGPDAHPDQVYILESGLIRIFRESADADEVTFGFVRPGEIFGESVLFGNQRESQAVAVQVSDVLILPRNVFVEAVQATPQMSFSIAKQIEGRFRNIETRVEDLVFHNARNRLARILLQLAQQFGKAEGDRTVLPLQLTHQDLATLIGTTRPTASLAINDLEQAELIGRQGRYISIESIETLGNAVETL